MNTENEKLQILRHDLYFIYPFEIVYNKENYSYDTHRWIVNKLLNSKLWDIHISKPYENETDKVRSEYFLSYVTNYLFPVCNIQSDYTLDQITKFDCVNFTLKDIIRNKFNKCFYTKESIDTLFIIKDINMIINSKGVALLIIKINLESPEITKMQDFNFNFRSLKSLHSNDKLGIITSNKISGHFFLPDLLNYLIHELKGKNNRQLLVYNDDNKLIENEIIESNAFRENEVYNDRMLVFTILVTDKFMDPLQELDFFKLQYIHSSNFKSKPNMGFLQDFRPNHIYAPWEMSKYGFSSEGGVFWGSAEDLFNLNIAPLYIDLMYIHLYYLAILQRTLLLRYSRLLADTDDLVKFSSEKKVKYIRTELLNFTNKAWFTHVTNFEQGQELWKRWVNILELNPLFHYVKRELQEIDDFVERAQSNRTSTLINGVTLLFIPLTVVSGIFGMNLKFVEDAPGWSFILSLVVTYIIVMLNLRKIKR